jgi:hypothetical protein
MNEHEDTWKDLCHQAWIEQDPVKFLNVSMKITKFLSRKQQRLDSEYEEIERREALPDLKQGNSAYSGK